MTNEEAKAFLNNLKVCIEEHPIVADWLVEIANRKTEPQTDGYMTAEQAEDYRKMLDKAEHKVYGNIEDEPQTARCLNCHNAKACKENHWEVCKYEPWKLTAVDDEPQIDCRRCRHYATDKCKECFGHELFTDSGYATDCSWQKGE